MKPVSFIIQNLAVYEAETKIFCIEFPVSENFLKMRRLDRIFTVGFCLVGLITGSAFVASGFYQIIRNMQSRSWQTTSAIIVYANKEKVVRRSGNGMRPIIKYRYNVDSVEFTGDVITFGHNFDTEEYADQKLVEYPVGASVSVFFDPEDPSISCLEQDGRSLGHTLGILGGLIIIAPSLYFLIREMGKFQKGSK